MSVVIWHIDQVVFDEIFFLLEVHCLLKGCTIFRREKKKNQGGQLPNYPNLSSGRMNGLDSKIRTYRLLDCCNQYDARTYFRILRCLVRMWEANVRPLDDPMWSVHCEPLWCCVSLCTHHGLHRDTSKG